MEDVDKYGIRVRHKNMLDTCLKKAFLWLTDSSPIPKQVLDEANEKAIKTFFSHLDDYMSSDEYLNVFINKHKGLFRAIQYIAPHTEAHRRALGRLWELERLLCSFGMDCQKLREDALK